MSQCQWQAAAAAVHVTAAPTTIDHRPWTLNGSRTSRHSPTSNLTQIQQPKAERGGCVCVYIYIYAPFFLLLVVWSILILIPGYGGGGGGFLYTGVCVEVKSTPWGLCVCKTNRLSATKLKENFPLPSPWQHISEEVMLFLLLCLLPLR